MFINNYFLLFGWDGALTAVEKEEEGQNFLLTMMIGEQRNNVD